MLYRDQFEFYTVSYDTLALIMSDVCCDFDLDDIERQYIPIFDPRLDLYAPDGD